MALRHFPEPLALVLAERTPAALLAAIRRAERVAEVAELRLDFLPSVAAIVEFLEKFARKPRLPSDSVKSGRGKRSELTLIATCRRRGDGGEFAGSPSAQIAVLELAVRAGCPWVDVDAATLESFTPRLRKVFLRAARKIVSFHDFKRTPKDLAARVRRAARLGADLVKVAATARTHGDAVRLLRLARRGKGKVIAVPMGNAGVPGRILALREGSPLTFAAPPGTSAVAPDLPGLHSLRDTYQAHRISRKTKVYGVAGNPALHSLSPAMHNAAFREFGVRAVYLPFETARLDDLLNCLGAYGVSGLSVTAPFKQEIIKHVHHLDPIAGMIGAVNTLVVDRGGKLAGFNTDAAGVLRCLQRRIPLECCEVLIVGAGGVARASAFALATAGSYVSVCARKSAKAGSLARAVGGEAIARKHLRGRRFDAIINCTPVGQSPKEKESPLLRGEINAHVALDMVYRPVETRFLRLARAKGAHVISGLEMLVEQGAAQFEIWNQRRAPLAVMRKAVRVALRGR